MGRNPALPPSPDSWRRIGFYLSALLLALAVVPADRHLFPRGGGARDGSGSDTPPDAALAETLAWVNTGLAAAWAEVAAHPERRRAWLRVASWEKRRADLLAPAVAPPEAPRPPPSAPGSRMESGRRERFMPNDLHGCLTRATAALRMALRAGEDGAALSPGDRRQALELLAGVRSSLGDRYGEVAALEDAVALAPEDARLWLRLAGAYGGARRFKSAEAARARALELIGGKEEAGR